MEKRDTLTYIKAKQTRGTIAYASLFLRPTVELLVQVGVQSDRGKRRGVG